MISLIHEYQERERHVHQHDEHFHRIGPDQVVAGIQHEGCEQEISDPDMYKAAVNAQDEKDKPLQRGHLFIDQCLVSIDVFVGIIEDEHQHHQHDDGEGLFEDQLR